MPTRVGERSAQSVSHSSNRHRILSAPAPNDCVGALLQAHRLTPPSADACFATIASDLFIYRDGPMSQMGHRPKTSPGANRHCLGQPTSIAAARISQSGDLQTNALQQVERYSITLSARARSEAGIVRPKAFAVLRLIASSYSVGCIMGRSAGGVPLRTLPV
jgi:hypothetical protein